mgnify:FL=1
MTAKELKELLWSKGWSKTDYNGLGKIAYDNSDKAEDYLFTIWFKKGLHTVTIEKLSYLARLRKNDGEKRVPLRLIEVNSNGTALIADGWEIKL